MDEGDLKIETLGKWKTCLALSFQTQQKGVVKMLLLTLENYAKAIQMVKNKGYDDKNTERIVTDIFEIVKKHDYSVEFFIEALPQQ